MAEDLRRWDSDCFDELCDIVFGQFLLGNFATGLPREPLWDVITKTLNARTRKDFCKRQVVHRFTILRREYCRANEVRYGPRHGWPVVAPDEEAGPSHDEERALEEELAADAAHIHLDDDYYTPNLDSIPRTAEETDVVDQTQATSKCPKQEASAKGKKVAKKVDKVSEMTVALKEYTAITRERLSGNKGKSTGTSKQFAQSTTRDDPCSLGKAIDMLNQYKDLGNKTYLNISKALHVKENKVVTMASRTEWLNAFLAYDFDEPYFNNIDYDDASHDTDDDDWWGSECDSEDEAEFDFVNPLVGEMFAYM
ncbi:hypothetical protein SO802_017538 [Lithocarpus litseifolius]|uniref:Myb/SANT-like domain-containing protein n=1 Tax=Lithocarpus litseifolius TaxID=425828 RepID=A0AAW2CN37_9ROSI